MLVFNCSIDYVRISRSKYCQKGDQGFTSGRRRNQVWNTSDKVRGYVFYITQRFRLLNINFEQQKSQHDVPSPAHEEFQHDAEMATQGDIEFRISDVSQHNSR